MSSARTHIAERLSSVAKQQHLKDDKTSTSICNGARRLIPSTKFQSKVTIQSKDINHLLVVFD